MSKIVFSLMNPISLYEVDPAEVMQYQSHHMDEAWLTDRLNRWQKGAPAYRQPWTNADTISIQLQTDEGQPELRIVDSCGRLLNSILMSQKQQNQYDPTTYIYQGSRSLDIFPPGLYYVMILIGDFLLISDLLEISERLDDSKLLEYSHRDFFQNIIFLGTDFAPSVRVNGLLDLENASKDTVYEDQELNLTMVRSRPYRLWNFTVGAGVPLPDWFIDKLNRVCRCSTFKIDGKLFTAAEGSKWEVVDDTWAKALKSYRIQLREYLNRDSKEFNPTINVNEEMNILLNVTSKGFADTIPDPGDTILRVLDVE